MSELFSEGNYSALGLRPGGANKPSVCHLNIRVTKPVCPAISESISGYWPTVKYVTVTSGHRGGRHLKALDDLVIKIETKAFLDGEGSRDSRNLVNGDLQRAFAYKFHAEWSSQLIEPTLCFAPSGCEFTLLSWTVKHWGSVAVSLVTLHVRLSPPSRFLCCLGLLLWAQRIGSPPPAHLFSCLGVTLGLTLIIAFCISDTVLFENTLR